MTSVSTILGQTLCAFAFCWRLERRDGLTIGLTSHDRRLIVEGLDYAPTPGITPSAIRRGGDVRADLTEVQGALSSAALSETDLRLGRWDGAAVRLYLTEWTDPGELWLELASGTLGSVAQRGQEFSVALRGLGTMLERPVAPATSPTCRAQLGDNTCMLDPRGLNHVAELIEVEGEVARFAGLDEGLYPFGRLRWLTGPCAGLSQLIINQTGDQLFLAEPAPLPQPVGARALLVQGCDKRLATCASRFANAANFRGEPFLPGMDLLTRYPGS